MLFNLIPNTQSRPIQADINWNGRMCNGGHGICYTQKDEKLMVKTETTEKPFLGTFSLRLNTRSDSRPNSNAQSGRILSQIPTPKS
jgi:hypothetical protein